MKRVCLVVVLSGVGLALAASAVARIPEPAALQPLPLSLRVIQPAGLLGSWFVVQLRAYAGARPRTVAGLREELASGPDRVVSVVVQCSSGRAAHDQLRAWRAQAHPTDMSVSFVDGDFAYLVDVNWRSGARWHLTRAQLLAVATALFQRVHGHPPG